MPRVTTTWYGDEFLMRMNRAAGRSIVGIGVAAAIETKRVTHVQEGTLRRSVHAAPLSADHSGDLNTSKTQDMMATGDVPEAEESEFGPLIELGSWLDYACVEWVGRAHPGVTQGLESVRGARSDAIVARAFFEEGL